MPDDLIAPDEHYPIRWQVAASDPLAGAVAVAFTRYAVPPGVDAVWFGALWTDPIPGVSREVQVVVAGSAAAEQGAHPGVGDFTCWLRYADGASVRIRPVGVLRFR